VHQGERRVSVSDPRSEVVGEGDGSHLLKENHKHRHAAACSDVLVSSEGSLVGNDAART